jgi:hypothetical protein
VGSQRRRAEHPRGVRPFAFLGTAGQRRSTGRRARDHVRRQAVPDTDGDITQVVVMEGIPGADALIVDSLRQWQLRPQPTPICSLLRIVYSVEARPKRK